MTRGVTLFTEAVDFHLEEARPHETRLTLANNQGALQILFVSIANLLEPQFSIRNVRPSVADDPGDCSLPHASIPPISSMALDGTARMPSQNLIPFNVRCPVCLPVSKLISISVPVPFNDSHSLSHKEH